MKKWNISTYRAERVDEKNGVFCLVLFTPKVMIIRMLKNVLFFILSVEYNKRSYLALLQNIMDHGVLSFH